MATDVIAERLDGLERTQQTCQAAETREMQRIEARINDSFAHTDRLVAAIEQKLWGLAILLISILGCGVWNLVLTYAGRKP